jgi:hypothetical protein
VGRAVDRTLRSLSPADRRRVILVGTSYETAAEIPFYATGHPRVYGPSHQYGLWGPPPDCGRQCLILAAGDEGELGTLGLQFVQVTWQPGLGSAPEDPAADAVPLVLLRGRLDPRVPLWEPALAIG